MATRTIDRTIIYHGGGDNTRIADLYEDLLNDNTIRSLSLKLGWSGWVVSNNPNGFPFQPGDRFLPLTTLHLDGYNFDDHHRVYKNGNLFNDYRVQMFRSYLADIFGFEIVRPGPAPMKHLKGSNLRSWKEAMDWPRLENLYLSDVDLDVFFEEMSECLTGLRGPGLRPRWRWTEEENRDLIHGTARFLDLLPRLGSLHLHGYSNKMDLAHVLYRHGPSLRRLELREWESGDSQRPRDVLTAAAIEQVNMLCPKVEHLSLDVNRNGTWPLETFSAFSAFESLSQLDINLELDIDQYVDGDEYYLDAMGGNAPDSHYQQPCFDAGSGRELFEYMRSNK